MQKKSEIEMERAKNLKIYRTLIRLKHSLNADEELNEVLPAKAIEYDAGVQNGELLVLSNTLEQILEQ